MAAEHAARLSAAIDGFLVPAFGPLRLEQLTPQAIQRWLTDHKVKHGGRRRITLAHATLRSALTDAQRLQLVSINAATLVKVPRPVTKAIAPLDLEQSCAFLVAAGKHRLGDCSRSRSPVGCASGKRRASMDDIDSTTGEMRIRQQLQKVGKQLVLQELKTAKSRRTLALPSVASKHSRLIG